MSEQLTRSEARSEAGAPQGEEDPRTAFALACMKAWGYGHLAGKVLPFIVKGAVVMERPENFGKLDPFGAMALDGFAQMDPTDPRYPRAAALVHDAFDYYLSPHLAQYPAPTPSE